MHVFIPPLGNGTTQILLINKLVKDKNVVNYIGKYRHVHAI